MPEFPSASLLFLDAATAAPEKNDLHKKRHTAAIMDCFNKKLGEITLQNKPSEFSKLLVKAKRYLPLGRKEIKICAESGAEDNKIHKAIPLKRSNHM